MDAKAEKIALFRFGVIASLVLEPLPRGELSLAPSRLRHSLFHVPIGRFRCRLMVRRIR